MTGKEQTKRLKSHGDAAINTVLDSAFSNGVACRLRISWEGTRGLVRWRNADQRYTYLAC